MHVPGALRGRTLKGSPLTVPSSLKKISTQTMEQTSRTVEIIDSNSTSCNASTREIELEELLASLDEQLLNNETLLDEAEANFTQSRDAYYVQDNVTNAAFDELVLAEQDVDLKGNDTIDNLNALINAHEAIGFSSSEYNNTMESFNATMEQLILQNQTYSESLESGNQTKIDAAASALNATLLQLVSSLAHTLIHLLLLTIIQQQNNHNSSFHLCYPSNVFH